MGDRQQDKKAMDAWYVLHCKGKQEERAQHNIENQGYTTGSIRLFVGEAV